MKDKVIGKGQSTTPEEMTAEQEVVPTPGTVFPNGGPLGVGGYVARLRKIHSNATPEEFEALVERERKARRAYRHHLDLLKAESDAADALVNLLHLQDGHRIIQALIAATAAGPIPRVAGDGNATAKSRPAKKRGRPPDTDSEKDRGLAEQWRASGCLTYAEFAKQNGYKVRDVMKAVARHRQRNPSWRKKSPPQP
jgi:hypothetical protein